MTIFYTHVLNGNGLTQDTEGQDFPDLAAAQRSALQAAGQILADDMSAGCQTVDLEMQIENAEGTRLATLPVSARVQGME